MKTNTTPIPPAILLEICAADIGSVYAASRGGAERVELCCSLGDGGLTPSPGMIQQARRLSGIKVNVLIRPRSGDFVYSDAEARTMLADIEFCRKSGVDGVVFGALTPDGDIDMELCRRLSEAWEGMHRTFHRAFDMCRNPRRAVRDIISLGFDRILTSGLAASASEGASLIRKLQQEFPEVIFIAAGGITPENAAMVAENAGVSEIHASAKETVGSTMIYRHEGVSMGTPGSDEFSRPTTSEETVRLIVEAISKKHD